MPTERIRVYADTCVFGGVLDLEFARPSKRFFDEVRTGKIRLVVSSVVRDELEEAPTEVRRFFRTVSSDCEYILVTAPALRLQRAYLDAGVVGRGSELDALHVALASAAGCAVIVSWNFRHIVNFRRIPMYNEVNRAQGFAAIAIHSPSEVVSDEY